MRSSRNVLLLTSTRLHLWYPALAAYARSHRWTLSIVERHIPPRNWRGDGVIAMQLELPSMRPTARWIARQALPVVNLSDTLTTCPVPTFGSDLRAAVRLAAHHCRQNGYENLAVYAFGQNPSYGEFLREAQVAWSGHEPFNWIVRHNPQSAPSREVHEFNHLSRLLKSVPKPVAVLAFNDYLAVQVEEACQALGLTIPSDVAIVGLGGIPSFSELAPVPITTVIPDRDRIIRKAATALDALMDGAGVPPAQTIVPPKGLVVRQSTDGIAIRDAELRAAFRTATADPSIPFSFSAASPGERIRLNRKSQEAFGLPFKALVLNARLHHAKTLLATTDDKIDTIARACSFCSASYFIKTFAEKFGQTPTAFRHLSSDVPS